MIIRVTDVDGLSVHQANAEAEQVGIYIGKVGDVVGILPSRMALDFIVGLLCNFLDL